MARSSESPMLKGFNLAVAQGDALWVGKELLKPMARLQITGIKWFNEALHEQQKADQANLREPSAMGNRDYELSPQAFLTS